MGASHLVQSLETVQLPIAREWTLGTFLASGGKHDGRFLRGLLQKQTVVVPRCASLSHTPLPELHTYSLPFATAKPCIQPPYTFERQMSEHSYHPQPALGATRLMWEPTVGAIEGPRLEELLQVVSVSRQP